MNDKIYFCSFASTNMIEALNRIKTQANEMELFTDCFLYTENDLPEYGKRRCENVINKTGTKRGYGYWTWKPVIINDTLKKLSDGDILIYSDAGSHLNPLGKKKLQTYIEMAKQNDIWVVELEECQTDRIWSKQDTIDFFSQQLQPQEKNSFNISIEKPQLESGTIIISNNEYTRRIMSEWEKIMTEENIHLFDDSPSEKTESISYKGNRHDQTILSLLLKNNHYCSTSSKHFYSTTKKGWKELKKNEPFLRLRDYGNNIPLSEKIKKLTNKASIVDKTFFLLFALLFIFQTSVFDFIKIFFLNRAVNNIIWISFINHICVNICIAISIVYVCRYFKLKNKLNYLFPILLIFSFLLSNMYYSRNGFYYGWNNKWNFEDFTIPVKGGYGDLYGTNYPPLIVIIIKALHSIMPQNSDLQVYASNYLLNIYIIFITLTLYLLFEKSLSGYTNCWKKITAISLFLTTPVLFAFQRMNLIFIAFIFTLIFIQFKNSNNKYKRSFSYLSLAIAANIKYFPAIYGLILLKQKKIKISLICFSLGLILFIAPAIPRFINHTISTNNHYNETTVIEKNNFESTTPSVTNILTATKTFASNKDVFTSCSIQAITYRVLERLNLSYSDKSGYIALFLFITVSIFAFFFAKTKHQEYIIISAMAILIPISSATYSFLFLLIPLMIFLQNEREEGIKYHLYYFLYVILFVFVSDSRLKLFQSDYNAIKLLPLWLLTIIDIFYSKLRSIKNK